MQKPRTFIGQCSKGHDVCEIDGQFMALDATDPLVSKLRENRKVNSRKSIAAKPPAPWYRSFDNR